MEQKGIRKSKLIVGVCIVVVSLLILAGTALFLYFKLAHSGADSTNVIYDKKYAFIANDSDDAFVLDVYSVAKEYAAKKGAYLELVGENLNNSYSSHELMAMAIASKYDGIIVEPDDTAEMTNLINKAVQEKIPVVTYMTDDSSSLRQCYIGMNFYVLGNQYGKVIGKMGYEDECRILVLTKETLPDSSKNNFYTSLMGELSSNSSGNVKYDVSFSAVDTASSFNVEEAVRDIVLYDDADIDVVLCMDEITTTSMYRALVDYNRVGSLEVVGYYNSDTILQGVERGVLEATVSVDANEMGVGCIDALEEYLDSGYVSEYISVSVEIID
ncbi:MAG: substrate-binding domain-containing protein [Lachnospiraceae bacterium]|nr:substrate-binding domain-containing protein [Lachnospiraceae bacterium]